MTRYPAAIAVLIVAAAPLWLASSPIVIALASLSGVLCLGGVFARSSTSLTTGAWLALVELTIALLWSHASNSLGVPAVFGLALMLLLLFADFDARFRGAQIDSTVTDRQVRHWIRLFVAATGCVLALAIVAIAMAGLIAPPIREVVAGVGALGAFLAVLHAYLTKRS